MRRGEATGNTQNRAQRLHTAPMEMIPKNGEKRKFHDLEKHEIKAKMGRFWGQKAASFALQSSLDCTSIQPRLIINRGSIAPQCRLDCSKRQTHGGLQSAFLEQGSRCRRVNFGLFLK